MIRNPVVAVVSPKGGNGKTTIAANLAAAMARLSDPVIVDLDVHFGDVEYAFRLRPYHRIDTVITELHEHPADGVEHLLTAHPTGLSALCAPADPVSADHLQAEEALGVVDAIIDLGRPVVIDTAGGISDYTLGALDRATVVIMVAGTDVPSVQAVRKLLDTMERLEMDTAQAHLVVNRATARCGLSVRDVEAAVERTAVIAIPEHVSLAAGMNQGSPVTETDPGSAVALPFISFARDLLGVEADSGGRWGRLVKGTS